MSKLSIFLLTFIISLSCFPIQADAIDGILLQEKVFLFEGTEKYQSNSEEIKHIPAEDIDIADVESPMIVGTSQVLSVTIIPINSTDTFVSYTSLTPEIASVNALGRVKALKEGCAKIQISVGVVKQIVSIEVEENISKIISPSKIDLDYDKNMKVDSTQTISVSFLPSDAQTDVKYSSSDTSVAKVNDFGKVTAISAGTVKITASAGKAKAIATINIESNLPTDIDLNYESNMKEGSTQTIYSSFLPSDAQADVKYSSSNPTVAKVNNFGKVTAVSAGNVTITASVGKVSAKAYIVVEPDKIPVEEIDLGDITKEMTVGTTQIISASLLPTNATDQNVKYISNNTNILKVNSFGRVTALKAGTATITASIGDLKKSVQISVVDEIVISTIEVSDFNQKMKVGSKQALSVSVFPIDAKNQRITYTSSNPSVATISEGGVITAVGKGNATIKLSCGKATEEIEIKVYIATDKITITDNYIILQPNDSYQIQARVFPSDADQNLTYKSTDSKIARVSSNGKITAGNIGKTSIIISNEDAMRAITVIVNRGNLDSNKNEQFFSQTDNIPGYSMALCEMISQSKDGSSISVEGMDYSYVTSDVLKALYNSQKSLEIHYDEYTVIIPGKSIKNPGNEFSSTIVLIKDKQGISFDVSKDQSLPGEILIEFSKLGADYQFLYIYNESAQKYKYLNDLRYSTATITSPGTYLLTSDKLRFFSIPVYFLIIGSILLCFGGVAYIIVKKRHLFW